jgi:hypothetical protein
MPDLQFNLNCSSLSSAQAAKQAAKQADYDRANQFCVQGLLHTLEVFGSRGQSSGYVSVMRDSERCVKASDVAALALSAIRATFPGASLVNAGGTEGYFRFRYNLGC